MNFTSFSNNLALTKLSMVKLNSLSSFKYYKDRIRIRSGVRRKYGTYRNSLHKVRIGLVSEAEVTNGVVGNPVSSSVVALDKSNENGCRGIVLLL